MDIINNPNYYKQERPYKDKYICGNCRKCFKRKVNSDFVKEIEEKAAKCPQCGEPAIWVGQKFEPPKSSDIFAWKTIEVMRRIGFWSFFGFTSDQVVIPRGKKELKKYLENLHAELDTIIDDGGLSKEDLSLKSNLRLRVEKELKDIS